MPNNEILCALVHMPDGTECFMDLREYKISPPSGSWVVRERRTDPNSPSFDAPIIEIKPTRIFKSVEEIIREYKL